MIADRQLALGRTMENGTGANLAAEEAGTDRAGSCARLPAGATRVQPHLSPEPSQAVRLPESLAPHLVVVVDTEEEFDWNQPFSRAETGVGNLSHQDPAMQLLARYGAVPTYVIDHPVAENPDSVAALREYVADGTAILGAHLHPWVNPPHEEEVSERNSYAGNLPKALERAKLETLTRRIEDSFGLRPTIYKAGRYGIGPNTAEILWDLGYEIDVSVYPARSYAPRYGPDFWSAPVRPYWFGPGGALLEIPLTGGFTGLLRRHGHRIYPSLSHGLGHRLHLPGILSRLGLLNNANLSPEGVPLREATDLTRALAGDGVRVFTLAYHSPSMVPGLTPYVRTMADRDRLLAWLDGFLAFFTEELGGVMATPLDILDLARSHDAR
ncbi:polysaccharide deacetylase family protein [Futiania mangrovi]|uniref:Polysaccharide deacetylase family protein n=1 Tax=Futiania mangrovi TaxID=2959716 RepID=A0A9J6PB10_9PROT|nr:polysaccharide deacetylase family protein [Futiania mangrovii]MCP1337300.1 polysaccharide deacetylase family protein [Futiania mangrovii]